MTSKDLFSPEREFNRSKTRGKNCHLLGDIFAIAICAVISAADNPNLIV